MSEVLGDTHWTVDDEGSDVCRPIEDDEDPQEEAAGGDQEGKENADGAADDKGMITT